MFRYQERELNKRHLFGAGGVLCVISALSFFALATEACGTATPPPLTDPAGNVVVSTTPDGGVGARDAAEAGGSLLPFDAAGCVTPAWGGAYGEGSDAEQTTISGIARDDAGNVYLAGIFSRDVNLGTGALHASGAADSFVGKVDAAGKGAWAVRFGGTGQVQVLGIAVNGAGDRVAITGTFNGPLTFGAGPPLQTVAPAVFLAMLDGQGAALWSHQYGGKGANHGLAVVFAPDGSLVTSGSYQTSIDLGDGEHTTGSIDGGGYLAKIDANGGTVWSRAYESSVIGANALAVGSGGDVFFTGYTTGAVDLGAGALSNQGGRDAIVAHLDGAGGYVYGANFGNVGDQFGYGVAALADGSLVVTGGFDGEIDFAGTTGAPLTSSTIGPDVFVAKLDAAGKGVWAVPGTKSASGISAGVTRDGAIVVLENGLTLVSTSARAGAWLRVIGADGSAGRAPLGIFATLDSTGERAVVGPGGDVLMAGSFSGTMEVCGVLAGVAKANETRGYLLDVPAAIAK